MHPLTAITKCHCGMRVTTTSCALMRPGESATGCRDPYEDAPLCTALPLAPQPHHLHIIWVKQLVPLAAFRLHLHVPDVDAAWQHPHHPWAQLYRPIELEVAKWLDHHLIYPRYRTVFRCGHPLVAVMPWS